MNRNAYSCIICTYPYTARNPRGPLQGHDAQDEGQEARRAALSVKKTMHSILSYRRV